jgi:ubiquinone/menaquinone biosynthesis C-methylase UbiE
MAKTNDIRQHFKKIAHNYRLVRVTDPEPVDAVIAMLPHNHPEMSIIDIGCGTGRYTERIIHEVPSRIRLLCVDLSHEMLNFCRLALNQNAKIIEKVFSVASASFVPCKDLAADLVLAFNAIHHFDIMQFLGEAGRILKTNGLLAIYTRTPEQNRQTIWGRYFPKFAAKESRLVSLDKLEKMITASPQLRIEEIKFFDYLRHISPRKLRELALAHHYSTFSLYSPDEFQDALGIFERRIREEFGDTTKIPHISPNVLILARKV